MRIYVVQVPLIHQNLLLSRLFLDSCMVYGDILYFIVAFALIVLGTVLMTPIVYSFWYDTIRPMVNGTTSFGKTMLFVGDLLNQEFQILGYAVAIITLGWGVAISVRTGVQEQDVGQQDF